MVTARAMSEEKTEVVRPSYSPDELPEYLPVYYKRLFPYGLYYRWLNYGGVQKNYFCNREFSFTLKDDVYIRYQSFSDQQEMEKQIQRQCPYKIDIGAVFSHKPKDHKTVKPTAFQALEKELVFDIDMTDYDDVRSCCQGADICANCWPLMRMAIKIVDAALGEDFGFEHRLWVYSGRRGVHCWVADEAARKLSQNARSAVAEYLSVVKGGENKLRKVHLPENIHPSIVRAIGIVGQYFDDYALEKQDILGDKDSWQKALAVIPDDKLRECAMKIMEEKKNSKERWYSFKKEHQALLNGDANIRKSRHCLQEIALQYCYPRLDVNVSKGINHLLKSPFCVHPKTGRVCVPIDPAHVDSFDPFKVPDINQLCQEIDEYDRKNKPEITEGDQPPPKKRMKDYKKTSLLESIEVFEKFVTKMEKQWKGKLLEISDQKGDF
ncbi:DNA primase small subunit [Holothuria leucospilota]|uniref:DNA primase n=1 Tax=Holothuria leucospilota TaxID=206669 RepID=A0A9Q1B9R4_HOLLE|nr:DNA primase small subunit [Holothuria leucospilota]